MKSISRHNHHFDLLLFSRGSLESPTICDKTSFYFSCFIDRRNGKDRRRSGSSTAELIFILHLEQNRDVHMHTKQYRSFGELKGTCIH